jgi:hypothetical protein
MTAVLFRVSDGEVTAVFPEEPADVAGFGMSCYAHVGQHSACSLEWYHSTRPATPAEYADLKRELERIGYVLQVYKRMTQRHRQLFRERVRQKLIGGEFEAEVTSMRRNDDKVTVRWRLP